jgi:sulfur-oxidizing protein SoxY
MIAGGVTSRRQAMATGVALAVAIVARPAGAAVVRRDADATEKAIRAFTGGAEIAPGMVTMDIPPLVENGNAAPLALDVPDLAEGVFARRIGVFNQKNPLPEVITLHLGPRCSPKIATRIRLADSQTITAIAELNDGSFHSATADVIVTLAACVEG